MEYTKLGNSDLTVSRICMGCMGFGDAAHGQHSWTIDEERSREIIKRDLELGVNFFDTAIAYQSGTSEQYLGRALRDFAKRDEVVVATKFLPRTPEEIDAGVSGQEHIRKMLDRSLQNLGRDYVDLYIYHMWDYRTRSMKSWRACMMWSKREKRVISASPTALPGSSPKPTRLRSVRALRSSSRCRATTT